jgi:hypothetical protein
MSEDHKTLGEALLAFQAEAPKLRKAATAKIVSKTGSSYSYKYLTLDDLMDAVLPVLNKHGLIWVTQPCFYNERAALSYYVKHVVSGDAIEGTMSLSIGANATPQEQGSAITYARRYSMLAVLGLVGDDDDDGGAASQRKPSASIPLNGDQPRKLTPAERARMIKAVEDAGQRLGLVLAAVNAGQHGDLNVVDAQNVKAFLDKLKDEGEGRW